MWSLAFVAVSSSMVSCWLLIVAACASTSEFLEVATLARLSMALMRSLDEMVEVVVAWMPRMEC